MLYRDPNICIPVRFLNPLLKLGYLTGRTDMHFVDTATEILVKYGAEQQDVGRQFVRDQKDAEEGPTEPSV